MGCRPDSVPQAAPVTLTAGEAEPAVLPAPTAQPSETAAPAPSPHQVQPSQPLPAQGAMQIPAHVDAGHGDVKQAGFFDHAGVIVHHPIPVDTPLYLSPYAPQITPNGYPATNAPLYPVPLPNIPYQTGGTFITNQAFDPHEMLYPHSYRSLYPPYYFEVVGGWKTLPCGVFQGEKWRLRGTVVTVKYHSSYRLLGGYCPLASPNVVWPFQR
jgi:hypothetical protein